MRNCESCRRRVIGYYAETKLFCELKAYFLQGYIVLTSPRNAPSSVLGIALDVLGELTKRGSARSSSQGVRNEGKPVA